MNRAYSILTLKAFDESARSFSGIATTPTPDRVGDVVDPLGAQFRNPLPLLLYHDSTQPVGEAIFDKPTKKGITFTATIAKVDQPGSLQDRLDTAWESVKAGLIRGVSIGFRGIKYAFMDEGGIEFQETEVVELSLVCVPAQAEATISRIKKLDTENLAALGRKDLVVVRLPSPGVSGKNPGGVFRLPKRQEATNEHSGTT